MSVWGGNQEREGMGVEWTYWVIGDGGPALFLGFWVSWGVGLRLNMGVNKGKLVVNDGKYV